MPIWDDLWTDARLVTMQGAGLGLIEPGALAVQDGRIAWVGAMADLPHREALRTHDAGGRFILPGFVDGHTHLVFAGNRIGEFERQLGGATRAELPADFVLWEISQPAELCYWLGGAPPREIVRGGVVK